MRTTHKKLPNVYEKTKTSSIFEFGNDKLQKL